MRLIRAGFLPALLVWAGSVYAAQVPQRQLVVLGGEAQEVRACLPLEVGETFYLEFVNSIYLAPVRESLVCADGENIFVVKVESPHGGVFEYYGLEPDGTGRISLYRKVGEIRIKSMSYETHRLTAGGRTLHLKDVAAPREPLVIRVRTGTGCGP